MPSRPRSDPPQLFPQLLTYRRGPAQILPASLARKVREIQYTLTGDNPLPTASPGVMGTPQFQALWTRTPVNWLKKGGISTGLVQCGERVCPHVTQTGHSRTLFLRAFLFSTLLEKPKLRGSVQFPSPPIAPRKTSRGLLARSPRELKSIRFRCAISSP